MSVRALGHPISTLRDGVVGLERAPIPLHAMRISIEIKRGLATISTTRSFRNIEAVPVEAILTFPVQFDSVTTGLRAVIDGRVLTANAQPRSRARQSYEDALDRGRTAVLHEEALRGVHLLSVGQLGPGASVDVLAEMAMPLSLIDGVPGLRVPMTVGHPNSTLSQECVMRRE
jgi:Vault protein inter-alpha-trypsin domain